MRTPHIHGSAVAGIWGIATLWVAVNPVINTHTLNTSRWVTSIAMLLMTAAATLSIGYLVQAAITDPRGTGNRMFELGYRAGRYDRQAEGQVHLRLLESPEHEHQNGKTGT